MQTLARFLAYAAEFEKTLVDDDWSRLEPYFGDDAVYRVESDLFGCELSGPAEIFAGMKKSLDGFDRIFSDRAIALDGEPEIDGEELRVGWTVTYQKDDCPPFVLRGRSLARLHDDQITLLVDSYDPAVDDELAAWVRETGIQLDPSYV
jgi:hypothetical protein